MTDAAKRIVAIQGKDENGDPTVVDKSDISQSDADADDSAPQLKLQRGQLYRKQLWRWR
jgi:hypothetical protein